MQTPPSFSTQTAPIAPPPNRVRFDAVGEAWRYYMADMGQWIVGLLLCGVIAAAPVVLVQMVVYAVVLPGGFSGAMKPSLAPDRLQSFHNAALISLLAVIPFNMCTQLLYVGLQRRAMLQVRGLQPPIAEIFNLNGMGFHVLAFNFLSLLVLLPAQLFQNFINNPRDPFSLFEPSHFLALIGLWMLYCVVQVLIAFTPLIIVDQRLPIGAALTKSVTTFAPHFFSLVGVFICVYLLGLCGLLGCLVGVIFTIPVVIVIYGVIYNDFFRPGSGEGQSYTPDWYPRPV